MEVFPHVGIRAILTLRVYVIYIPVYLIDPDSTPAGLVGNKAV
jgi:hypothetical protein